MELSVPGLDGSGLDLEDADAKRFFKKHIVRNICRIPTPECNKSCSLRKVLQYYYDG